MPDSLDLTGDNPWTTTDTAVLFDNGRIRLREDEVIGPDGRPGRYAYVEVPFPIVGIVALDDDNRVELVRQWRYPWRCNSWELPSGACEAGEDPLDGARRELAEEVGLTARHWRPLATGFSSATVAARYHLYVARGLEPSHGHERDGSEEDLIAQRVPLQQAVEAVLDGTIAHSFSVVGILRVARLLGV